ncbi:MAG: DUF917 domain-containing protein [Christensenella sp.]|nr:DUF917 domain-containing protein [Christensenella sp.]
MVVLKKQDLLDVIWGATLMGGGGGGSSLDGLALVKNLEENNKGVDLELKMISASEMEDGAYAAVTAGMGAPTVIKTVNFGPYAANSFEALREMVAKMDDPKDVKYCIPVESGGFNTFVPMFISILKGYPFVDADGCGRAVPALNTLLLHINGCDTSPLAMANGANDKLTIELSNARDAELAEEVGRHICMAFGMLSGLSGWILSKKEICENIPTGVVSMELEMGRILREAAEKKETLNVFEQLRKAGVEAKEICVGEIVKTENKQADGFDYGVVEVKDAASDVVFVIYFQNENLLVAERKNGKETPLMTVPDIICMYDIETGMPLTNADVKEGLQIGLGAIKVNGLWWKNPAMFDMWRPFLKRVGYTGENIPFEKL